MRVSVKRWGNSASVRIPAAVMRAARLALNQPVDVREEDGRIVIEPIPADDFDVEALVAAITDDNQHDPVEIGPAVGREVW